MIKTKWDVTQAVDYYYANDVQRQIVQAKVASINEAKALQLFDKYKKGNIIDEDQIFEFYKDLGIDMETDIVTFMFSYNMQVKDKQLVMGEYTKEEFLQGCKNLGVDDLAGWKSKIATMRADLKNDAKFKEMYKFVFGFACEKGMKSVEIDTALALWPTLLGNRCKFMDKWVAFIQGKADKKEIGVMTKDTWDLFFDLVQQTNGDWSKFEDDGAWPVLVDGFVEYMAK